MQNFSRPRRNLQTVFALVLLTGTAAASLPVAAQDAASQDAASQDCWDKATSQGAMTACGLSELDKAEMEMNALYAIMLDKVRGDADTVRKIRKAQEAWRAFRAAHAEAVFPKADTQAGARAEYGSSFPMCWAAVNMELTEQRIAQLREWVDGIPEGDVCAGSRGFPGN